MGLFDPDPRHRRRCPAPGVRGTPASWSRSVVLSEERCAVSSEENKAVVRRFFENAGSGTRDDELIAEDFIYHGPPMLGEVRGREGFKQLLGGFRAAFPN